MSIAPSRGSELEAGLLERSHLRWPTERARGWFEAQPWRLGCNFLPSSASNQLEMWQPSSFSPNDIDRELGWAAELGYTMVRTFLHDLLWEADGAGFMARIDTFLAIAAKHSIGVMLVLFDGCWDPWPELGRQREPRPHIHNSRWVQSPGARVLNSLAGDSSEPALRLERYVKDVLSRFGNDSRVVIWDLFNEGDNGNVDSYGNHSSRVEGARGAYGMELPPLQKAQAARWLMRAALGWARDTRPMQPLTMATYEAPTFVEAADAYRQETAVWIDGAVDVVSFHHYGPAGDVARTVDRLLQHGRPVLCTEFLARPASSGSEGSHLAPIVSLLRSRHVWAVNWGFVSGRSQTIYPWESWQEEFVAEPSVWHHDILRGSGTPYSLEEASFLRSLRSGRVLPLSTQSPAAELPSLRYHPSLTAAIAITSFAALACPRLRRSYMRARRQKAKREEQPPPEHIPVS